MHDFSLGMAKGIGYALQPQCSNKWSQSVRVCVIQGVKVLNMEVQPRALSPTFLSNRTKDISQSVSAAIFSTFQKAGLLDYADFLLDDPR